MVDKQDLHAALVAVLERDHRQMVAAQRLTSEGVVHEDNRSEGSKDMRATEAAYIARGQAQRAEALAADLARARAMPLRVFGPSDPIALSAVVVVTTEEGEPQTVFLAPAGGGTTLAQGEATIRVVTPIAPLGRALLGTTAGDEVVVMRDGRPVTFTVEAVF
jgi:transcription elongation GreA/GreB family factor